MYTLITGASSGIGLELARVCAAHQQDLILVARSQATLETLAEELRQKHSVHVQVLPIDLALSGAAEKVFQITQQNQWPVQILINNAGFGDHGAFVDADFKKQSEMIQVNIMALTQLKHVYLKAMRTAKSGWIMNVASTAAFQPGPLMAVYYATKSYVLSFSEALAEELRDSGVKITALCPGPTLSGFQEKANLSNVLLFKGTIPTSQDVAVFGFKAMMKGQVVAIHGAMNRMGATSIRFAPRSLVVKMVKRLQEKRFNT